MRETHPDWTVPLEEVVDLVSDLAKVFKEEEKLPVRARSSTSSVSLPSAAAGGGTVGGRGATKTAGPISEATAATVGAAEALPGSAKDEVGHKEEEDDDGEQDTEGGKDDDNSDEDESVEKPISTDKTDEATVTKAMGKLSVSSQ